MDMVMKLKVPYAIHWGSGVIKQDADMVQLEGSLGKIEEQAKKVSDLQLQMEKAQAKYNTQLAVVASLAKELDSARGESARVLRESFRTEQATLTALDQELASVGESYSYEKEQLSKAIGLFESAYIVYPEGASKKSDRDLWKVDPYGVRIS